MSRATITTASQARAELLGRLGLPADAHDDVVSEAHRQLGEFLDGAPDDLRGWADKRQAEADRIVGLVTGPRAELAELVAARQATAPARGGFPVWARWLVGVLAVVGLVVGVYLIGRPQTDPPPAAPASTAPAAPVLNEAKVTELSAKVEQNPQDVAALFDLGNTYYQAQQYPKAAEWYQKVLDVDANNEKGLIALGATSFVLDDYARAEAVWTRAAELYPTNPEVFYDLGFVYMATKRPDEMKAAWDKVIELAPESDFAKTIQSHG